MEHGWLLVVVFDFFLENIRSKGVVDIFF